MPPRTTMDFLFELDSPVPSSAELDLRSMPDVQAAIAASNARESGARPELPELPRDSFHPGPTDSIEPPPYEPASDEAGTAGAVPTGIARISLRPQSNPSPAPDPHDQRKRRLVSRLVTCRDAFRVLGFLDIKESDRSEIARLMMALDPALDPSGKAQGVAKEPAAMLASATQGDLERVERLVSPIEDKLLALDELVTDQALAMRVEAGKLTAKTLAFPLAYWRGWSVAGIPSRPARPGGKKKHASWIATSLAHAQIPTARVKGGVGQLGEAPSVRRRSSIS